jgi:predicted nucleotidyltransferase
MIVNQDFREFIQSLNDNRVRYLVIGGYAVALYGYPRYTKDLDIWIEPNSENVANLLNALKQFGFGSLNLQISDFIMPDQVIQLGYPPNRIDLITTPSGVIFDDCFASKTEVVIEDLSVNFIDLENLKQNKKASGRLQDLADLENLI